MQVRNYILAVAAISSVASIGSAATFVLKSVVDLTTVTNGTGTNDIGSNASAIAWDGSTAYLAGYNGGGSARDTALVNVSNVLTSPTLGSRYGLQAGTASGRGYVGGDFKSGVGFATVFDSGTTSTSYIRLDNTSGTNVFQTTVGGRPPAGPSFDTLSTRLSLMYQGTNSVTNYDVTTGSSTGTVATNIQNIAGLGTAYRDFDYDSSGNLYARLNNNLVRANRATATSYSATPTLLVDLTDANNVGENVAVVEGFPTSGSPLFVLYNDKASNTTGQAFASTVKAVRADGTAEPLSFLGGDESTALTFPAGTGFYDFSYDSATKTLALLDFTNRQFYIFGAASTVPEPTTLGAVASVGLIASRRRR